MAERGIILAHTTLMRWCSSMSQHSRKRWRGYARRRHLLAVDETYIKSRGKWGYLYRAVDAAGKTVDFS